MAVSYIDTFPSLSYPLLFTGNGCLNPCFSGTYYRSHMIIFKVIGQTPITFFCQCPSYV